MKEMTEVMIVMINVTVMYGNYFVKINVYALVYEWF